MKPYLTTSATLMLLSLSAPGALSIAEPKKLRGAAALTCNETDALIQVKYNITEDEWNNSRPLSYSFGPSAFLHLQGNENEVRYENYATLTDYEACLPRDECSEVVVGGLPTDAYELSFDGKTVDIGQEFLYDGTNPVTSTEVGSCTKPICKDNEALLEIQYWGGHFSYNIYHFRVEDKDGGTILSGEPVGRFSLTQSHACLPKADTCYTFLIGGANQWPLSVFPLPSYSVIFDGKLVRRSDSWLFDSVQFGGSCKAHCNQDDESLIEFFLYDNGSTYLPGVEYEYEWDLNNTNPSSSETVSSGVVPMGLGASPLAHEILCVPKSSCSSFYISAPNVTREVVRQVPADNTTDWNNIVWVNVTRNETQLLRPVYSLTMDNVTYRKVQWMSPEGLTMRGSDNQTTNMGSCTVEGLCDVQTQDLFDLELHTPAKHEFPSFETFDMRWNFGYTEYEADEWQLQNLLQDIDYNDRAYDLDSSYGAIECVPKDGCDLSFNITAGSPVDSWTVKKNGIQLDHRKEEIRFFGEVLMTPFGQNCFPASDSYSLSGGAIAGIVIACVVAVGAIVFGLVWCKSRQTQSSKEEVEKDPLHESLL